MHSYETVLRLIGKNKFLVFWVRRYHLCRRSKGTINFYLFHMLDFYTDYKVLNEIAKSTKVQNSPTLNKAFKSTS